MPISGTSGAVDRAARAGGVIGYEAGLAAGRREATPTDPQAEVRRIHVRWSDDGQHIRRWQHEPFADGEPVDAVADTRGGESALREALCPFLGTTPPCALGVVGDGTVTTQCGHCNDKAMPCYQVWHARAFLDAALASPAAPEGGVPDGMVLVPVKLTENMKYAAESAASIGIGKPSDDEAIRRVWSALLAARPPLLGEDRT